MKIIQGTKRFVAVLLTVVVMLTAVPLEAFASTGELLLNGGFSEGSLKNWNTQGDVAILSDNGVSGSYATLSGMSEIALLQSDLVTVEAESNYMLSASVQSFNGDVFRAKILQYSNSMESTAGPIEVPVTLQKNEWDEFSYIFRTAADATHISVYFENSAGMVYIDNVSIKETSKNPVYKSDGTTVDVQNANFRKKLLGWVVDGTVITTEGFSGHGAELVVGSSLSQEGIQLQGESLYELHYYIKATDATACESAISLTYRDGNDEEKTVTPYSLVGNSAAGGWQEVTAQFATDYVNSVATLRLEVTADGTADNARVAFDEIALTQLESYTYNTPYSLAVEEAENLFTNGSFVLADGVSEENFAMTTGFSDKKLKWMDNNGATANLKWSVIDDAEHGKALKISGSSTAGGYWLQQAIAWEAGKTYEISYWMKTGSTKVNQFYPNVAGNKASTSSTMPPSSTFVGNKANTEWVQHTFEFTPTVEEAANQYMRFMYVLKSSNQTVYLADVKVIEKQVEIKRLDNGTFVEGTKSWSGFAVANITDGVAGGAENGQVLKVTADATTVIKHDAFTDPLIVGQQYTLRFRMRNNALSGVKLGSVYFTQENGSGKIAESNLSATNGVWQEFVVDFTAQSGYEKPQLCMNLQNASGVEVAFADFSFAESVPILSNGDFREVDSNTSTGVKDWEIVWIEGTNGGTHELVQDEDYGTVVKISKPKVDGNATDLRNATLNTKLSIGQKYVISFDVKTTGTTDSDASVGLLIRKGIGSGTITALTQSATNGEWKTVSYEFVPTEGYQDIQLWIRANPRKRSSLEITDYYIANVSITRAASGYQGNSEIMNSGYTLMNGTYPEFWGLLGDSQDKIEAYPAGDISAKIAAFYAYLDTGTVNATKVEGKEISEWTKYSFEYTASESSKQWLRFMYKLTSKYQTVYLADVEVREKGSTNADNLFTNGEFQLADGVTSEDFAMKEGFIDGKLAWPDVNGATAALTWSVDQDSKYGNVFKVTGSDTTTGYFLQHAINWEAGKTYEISYWMKTGTSEQVSHEANGYLEAINNSGKEVGASTLLPVYSGADYTLQFWIKANETARESFALRLTGYTDYKRTLINGTATSYADVTLKDIDEWQLVEIPLAVSADAQYLDLSFLVTATGADFKLSGVQVALGESAKMNWSFEIGDDKPISWTYNGSGLLEKVSDSVDGDYAASITNASTGHLISGTMDVESNAIYEISYWIKTSAPYDSYVSPAMKQMKEDGTGASGIVFSNTSSNYRTISAIINLPWSVRTYGTTEEWKQVRHYFRTAEDAAKLYLDLGFTGSFDSVLIDDIKIVKKDTIANFDFEEKDEDGNPEGWYLTDAFDTEPILQQDASVWHSGSASAYMKLDTTTSTQQLMSSKLIPIDASGEKRIFETSFWVASRNANLKSIQCDLWYYDANGIKLYSSTVELLTASAKGTIKTLNGGSEISEWSQVITRTQIPEEAKYVSLVFTATRGSAEIWLDDIFFDQVESDTQIVAAHNDFHAVDHNGAISGWTAEDGGRLVQKMDEQEGTYGLLSGGSMAYRTNVLGTAYSYAITVRYDSAKNVDLKLRFNDYKGHEYADLTMNYTLPATLGWSEETITFTAPSATTCDVVLGNEGELSVSEFIIYQTAKPATRLTWTGKWVGYSEVARWSTEYDHSYYRKEITLPAKATYAPLQITADDKFALYVNGTQVYNGIEDITATWAAIQVFQLENYLVEGENVLAIEVYNQSAYSAVLFDGIWTLENGELMNCMSDGTLLGRDADPDSGKGDWKATDYDDSDWKNVYVYGDVPMTPWGDVYYDASLYIDNLIELQPAEGDGDLVNDLEYEFAIKIKIKEPIETQIPFNTVLWRRNSTTSICNLTPILLDHTDMREWPVGEWFTVKMKVTLPDYIDDGNYTLQLSDEYFIIENEDIYDNKFISFKAVNDYTPTELVTKVETINGVPTFTVNGEAQSAFWYTTPFTNLSGSLSTIEKSGIETYVNYQIHLGQMEMHSGLWNENGSFNYQQMDEYINTVLAASADANLIVSIGMFAPEWWLEQNPGEVANSMDVEGNITTYPAASYGSEKWKIESGEMLANIIAHMREQPYYSRVAGIRLLAGKTYENITYGSQSNSTVPDYSEAAQNYFRKWAKEEYGTIGNLRKEWNDPTITSFDSIELPTFEELRADGGTGMLYNPATQQKLIDFRHLMSEMTADTLLYWGKVAKEATDNKLIVGAYYGYLFAGNDWSGGGVMHEVFDEVVSSPYLDFFATPQGYNERQLGEAGYAQTAADSITAYGKLYVQEQDNRTVLTGQFAGASWEASSDFSIGRTHTMEDTILQEKRDAISNIVNGYGSWLFDMQGGWLNDNQIYELTNDINEEYNFVNYIERDLVNDIALIIPDEYVSYLRTSVNVAPESATLLNQVVVGSDMYKWHRKQLGQIGSGFDTYALSTLENGKMPEHKINVFLTPYVLSEEQRNAIDTYCKDNNQINVFLYMSGYGDEDGYDLENMKELTGFTFGLNETSKSSGHIEVIGGSSLTSGMEGSVFGAQGASSKYYLQEIYVQPSDEQIVLGTLRDTGNIGFAMKEMEGWTSIYCAAPNISADFYRNLLETADAHIYSDNPSDIIWSNSSYVGVHSAASGEKKIYLPQNYAVYDVFEEKYISLDTNIIVYENVVNDTHLFRLTPVNTYSFLSYVKGGHGTISSQGLQQIAPGSSKTLEITPDAGYMIQSVVVNGEMVEVSADNTLRLSNINSNYTIVVRFKRLPVNRNLDEEIGEETGEEISGIDKNVAPSTTPDGDTQTVGGEKESIAAMEEVWATILDIISISPWLFVIIAGVTGGIIVLILFIKKKKEEQNGRIH